MEKYEMLEINVVFFPADDVIVCSVGDDDQGEEQSANNS